MSGMVMGGMLEADRRIREYQAMVRVQRKLRLDRAVWDKYENEFSDSTSSKHEK